MRPFEVQYFRIAGWPAPSRSVQMSGVTSLFPRHAVSFPGVSREADLGLCSSIVRGGGRAGPDTGCLGTR
jgi:hypothetical protein